MNRDCRYATSVSTRHRPHEKTRETPDVFHRIPSADQKRGMRSRCVFARPLGSRLQRRRWTCRGGTSSSLESGEIIGSSLVGVLPKPIYRVKNCGRVL